MTKLKPCPFCGGIAKISGGISITPIIDENGAYVDADMDEGYGYTIQCSSCGCEIVEPWVSDEDDADEATWESVINKWNNRPSPWHTGTPTEAGTYLVLWKDTEEQMRRFSVLHWNEYNDTWYDEETTYCNWGDEYHAEVIAWQKIEPFKDDSKEVDK